MKKKKKIVFFINHVSFFVSHRIPLALHARKCGYDVSLLTGLPASKIMESEALKVIEKYNIKHKRVLISSSGFNIFIDIVGLLQILFFFLKNRPNIIHAAATKPILYGSFISKLLKINGFIISFAGMGYIFTGKANLLKKLLQKFIIILQRWTLSYRKIIVIVQNKDDENFLIRKKIIDKKRIITIKGSGVDLDKFKYSDHNYAKKIVLFPSRLLKNKGVMEFLEASKILSKKYPEWKFLLVGAADYDHPTTIKQDELSKYLKIKNIKWLGYKSNMHNIYKKCSIVCLPSYREGMPKSLLEAASIGRPVVTTNVIGCKDAIINNKTGFLVPSKNVLALMHSLEILMTSIRIRSKFGKRGRELAEKTFDLKIVKNRVINLYDKILSQ